MKYIILLCAVFLISCTGTYDENQAKMDEIYGCKKPGENLSKKKYQACLAKERAMGETLFNLEGDLNDLISGRNKVVYQSAVNPYLWNAALQVTNTYPLIIADSQGGFIQTDWIINNNDEDLITTGVSSKFLCENKLGDNWNKDNIDYIEEEKQITLKILEVAGTLEKADT